MSCDAEVAELELAVVADEHIERREVAMQHAPAVELAEHLEHSRNLAPRPGFRPRLAIAAQKRAEIAVPRVLERQAIEDLPVDADQWKTVVDADGPRMLVEQLPEVRLA